NKRKARVCAGSDSDKRHLLHISAFVTSWLQSVKSELRRNVFGGQVAAALAGSASFKKIEREETHVRFNVFRLNGLHGSNRRAGQTMGDSLGGDWLELLSTARCNNQKSSGERDEMANRHA